MKLSKRYSLNTAIFSLPIFSDNNKASLEGLALELNIKISRYEPSQEELAELISEAIYNKFN